MDLNIDTTRMTEFLVELLNIPSPTGYHVEAIPFIQEAFGALDILGYGSTLTPKGALVCRITGNSSLTPVALTAHADTLGYMVKEIKSDGSLKVFPIGGITYHGTEFENVTIRTFDDQRYRGTVILHNPSTHVNADYKKKARDADNMEVRIDAKVSSADETRALGIEVGDFVFVDPRVEVTETGFIRSRFLDNKAGVAVIYGALLVLKELGERPAQDTAILISNYEEVGHGGAHGIPADVVELLTVDMAALGDGQTGDEFSASICVADAGGPYHYDLTNRLRRIATAHNITAKPDIYPYYWSDGSVYWRAGGAARVALMGPGVASSHGYERTHTDALAQSALLIARYLLDVES